MGECPKRGMRGASPCADQIEFTLFGPGYGECAVVHLGANRWMVVDSCLDTTTGKPAVLEYFDVIGVSAKEAVRLIVVSHWHDDHVRGLGEVVLSCPNASVCCSSALTKEEFLAHVLDYENIMTQITSAGVREIAEVLRVLKDRSHRPKIALVNRQILSLPADGAADPCTVTTLSPSDVEYALFLSDIATMLPQARQTKLRSPSSRPNDVAVALWVEMGPVKLLLGSDLEDSRGDTAGGWSAIIQSTERPKGRASIFKVPHHGSVTGHHDRVWSEMVAQSPIAVLSPFHLADITLPSHCDVARIVKLAPESYITTRDHAPRSKKQRISAVERTIRETVGKIRLAQPRMGWVRLRNGGKSDPNNWNVELSHEACRLDALAGGI